MSHRSPAVSVVMAVYNGLPYLPRAIESVLGQTFADFELVVVDDASTDDTAACVRSYGDPRIHLVRNDRNLGQTASLNRGLGLARGAHVARLDADDECLPERFARQAALLAARPEVAVVGSWMYRVAPDGRETGLVRREWRDFGTYVAWLLLEICPLWHPTVMFRRDVVAGVGGYDETFRIAQDYDLWIRLALRGHRAAVVPEPLVRYRVHSDQLTVVHEGRFAREIELAHDRMVGAVCPSSDARQLALLLRTDDRFWPRRGSAVEMVATCRALGPSLESVRTMAGLSDGEFHVFRRLVHRRLGSGIRLGAKLRRWPAPLVYAVVFGLSPLMIPGLRRRLRGLRRAMLASS